MIASADELVSSGTASADQWVQLSGLSRSERGRRVVPPQSMGRVGSALDNAAIESWHSTLEFELRSRHRFTSKAEACTAVAAWIEDYNYNRRHSACQMPAPVAYEQLRLPDQEQEAA